jgi:hypothetical protein
MGMDTERPKAYHDVSKNKTEQDTRIQTEHMQTSSHYAFYAWADYVSVIRGPRSRYSKHGGTEGDRRQWKV